MTRTIVYIDGFNLYYRALKGTPHKWLDIEAMSRAALPHTCAIERINYYTAHISGRVDAGAPRRQHAYLRAIATLPKVAIHYGNFGRQLPCRPALRRRWHMSGRRKRRGRT